MTITLHNTLAGKKEEFTPLCANHVNMYVCGITPYDEVHLGHARAYVTFDIVRRHLELSGYRVTYIQNFTDVDDKIIRRAAERGCSPAELAGRYIDDYFTQMDRLNIRRATAYPRVTETIPQIVAFIETLIARKKAYAIDGDVYFSVRASASYGALSRRNTEELLAGARIEIDDRKKDPMDFALWKRSKPGEPADVSWESPWGKGRPGWHIECSVMSTGMLGPTLDIHGGGQDLIFPHHENEIAQSEAATGKPFARYWIHNGFVTVNHEKMSKSLGNFFTLNDIFKKYHPRAVRYFLLSQHYRSPLDFSDDKLEAAANALAGLDEAWQKLAQAPGAPKETPSPKPAPSILKTGTNWSQGGLTIDTSGVFPDLLERFTAALNDDFNTEKALAVLHDLKRDALNASAGNVPDYTLKAYRTFSLFMQDYLGISLPMTAEIPAEVLTLQKEREEARRAKNWARSDELRKALDAAGYKVEDKPGGTSLLIKKSIE